MTEIYRNDLIYSISYALDFVEHDLVAIAPHHSKRIALISAELGEYLGFNKTDLMNLAVCAALHDNALTEYQQIKLNEGKMPVPEMFSNELGIHCSIGERNISTLPFYPMVKGAVLYHHENSDGSGPFGLTADKTPPFARIIHIADTMDAYFDLSKMDDGKFGRVMEFVANNAGSLYDEGSAEAFKKRFSSPEKLKHDIRAIDERLKEELPEVKAEFSNAEIIKLADFFAKIIDFKSRFTYEHSEGVAKKAAQMAEYFGWSEDKQAKIYLAGALHDVGKLMISTEILEKPGKLTDDEFKEIKEHAHCSYEVLWNIRGLEEVTRWAYDHHEKLDGTGYPFGKRAEDLGTEERLMGCIDIYQALREDRPYREGMLHEDAMAIMRKMVDDGKTDAYITDSIDHCFGRLSTAS